MSSTNQKEDLLHPKALVNDQGANPIIGVTGLGYVGLPVALGFSEKYKVIGYDINEERVGSLANHHDRNGESSSEDLRNSQIDFTTDQAKLNSCHVIIVAVPTPVSIDLEPDFTFLKNVSITIGRNMAKGTIVVYESTVYPGATEEVCIPILEEESGLKAGKDFFVGYSPERINPGDKEQTFHTINKIVSAQDEQTLDKIHNLYQSVISSEIFKAPSIKVAEAAKVIENTQRDINIAFMNEVSLIFNKLNINIHEVIEAASTKWNFLPFYPGLVGGHCIGVDPYYLIHKAKTIGCNPRFISTAREINDRIPEYIVHSLLKLVTLQKMNLENLTVTVLGVTFKQNIPDTRNSKALEIVDQLQDLGVNVQVCDPHVQDNIFIDHTNVNLKEFHQLKKSDVVIYAVPHSFFTDLPVRSILSQLKDKKGIIMDIKGVLSPSDISEPMVLWSL